MTRRGIYRLLDALIVQPVAAAQDAEGDQQNQRPYPAAAPVCLQSPAHFPASPPVCRLCKVKSAIWEPIQTNYPKTPVPQAYPRIFKTGYFCSLFIITSVLLFGKIEESDIYACRAKSGLDSKDRPKRGWPSRRRPRVCAGFCQRLLPLGSFPGAYALTCFFSVLPKR